MRVLAPADAPAPPPGSVVAATGRLRVPRAAENPGERGPREALAERGISHLLILGSGPSLEILERAAAGSPRAIVHRARRRLDAALAGVAPDASGLLALAGFPWPAGHELKHVLSIAAPFGRR